MKNIEQIIKDSLENHEMPYDGAAWEAMSKRLDGTTPSPFYRKWWVAASIGTVLVGSSLFFGLNNQTDSSKTADANAPVATKTNTTTPTNNQADNRFDTHTNPQTNTPNEQQVATNSVDKTQQSAKPHVTPNQILEVTPLSGFYIEPIISTKNDSGNPSNEQKNYLPVQLAQTNLCIGDEIEITNPNDALSISVIQNNRTQLIKPGGKRVVTANVEGTIEVVSGKNTQTIAVNRPSDKLYISADPTVIYNNGIPSVEFTGSGAESTIHWTVEKYHGEVQNGNFIVHPYTGKDITVKATSKDLNGCTVTETKTISIKEEYNLQAVNAININSGDSRNNRFMPYALIERNIAFELYIYDAKTGRVIYKTNDTSNGWDGTDMNTGSLVQASSVHLWKVIIKNPLPGEPKEYKGTILVNN
ncbi:hypothetical protein [Fluviicola taffensis]|uniref:Uncharacterized protein n=1 Tax=Fluviicola taffensis (strain DSM 16823 / NCIMB 13979 / RW262) TaxID=755732 RepID=F2IKK4_FLUTR|nr:hypothetical protein [Fluviicola taffensis]AEA45130.1 hypothetical protein Fluta_3156 [Fluviicola taffensis DSM 16823]